jgi:hypothetical protein
MADVAILNPQVEAAPTGYTIPGAQELILKSVKASYDGSGAGGDYVPTLQFVAPNGTIVSECPLGSTVTAGDDVDVTWFPRGGVAKTQTASSGTVYAILNGIGANVPSSPDNQPYVPVGTFFSTTDDGSNLEASVTYPGYTKVLSAGLYTIVLAGYGLPSTVLVSAVAIDDTGTPLFNDDIYISWAWNLEGFVAALSTFGQIQKDYGAYTIQTTDIAGGVNIGAYVVAPSGWSQAGEHGINMIVYRVGDLPT